MCDGRVEIGANMGAGDGAERDRGEGERKVVTPMFGTRSPRASASTAAPSSPDSLPWSSPSPSVVVALEMLDVPISFAMRQPNVIAGNIVLDVDEFFSLRLHFPEATAASGVAGSGNEFGPRNQPRSDTAAPARPSAAAVGMPVRPAAAPADRACTGGSRDPCRELSSHTSGLFPGWQVRPD